MLFFLHSHRSLDITVGRISENETKQKVRLVGLNYVTIQSHAGCLSLDRPIRLSFSVHATLSSPIYGGNSYNINACSILSCGAVTATLEGTKCAQGASPYGAPWLRNERNQENQKLDCRFPLRRTNCLLREGKLKSYLPFLKVN